jgi:menaquinone-dependent protoporphyrinogen oxidase
VAEAIAQTLREHGAQVDVIPMQEVTDLTAYQAIVAGSTIQNRGWLPEAVQFVRTHRSFLNQKPFAIFALCMTLAMKNGESFRPQISDWLAPVRSLVRPVSEGIFAGALDIGKIPSFGDRLKFRLSVLFGVWSEGDHRDWDAIHAWAEDLSVKLL